MMKAHVEVLCDLIERLYKLMDSPLMVCEVLELASKQLMVCIF